MLRVGLLERQARVEVTLPTGFRDAGGLSVRAGDYVFVRDGDRVTARGPVPAGATTLRYVPGADASAFALRSRVGAEFHWSEPETLRFAGALCVEPDASGLRVVNEVPLERYLESVVSSEMSATCPDALIRAHSVVARSWLLAQLASPTGESIACQHNDQGLRWYDRTAHEAFDVCAEDHCQRYHGVDRIGRRAVIDAVASTRGEVLQFDGAVCDTRYSKCCGGVVEDARVAWSDAHVPYLIPLYDGDDDSGPQDLSNEQAFREFLRQPPDAYCHCSDGAILDMILPERDRRTTPDFFRWEERIEVEELSERVRVGLGRDLGRILALVPIARGRSGRLWKLRIDGEAGSAIVGKELEIRRVLSRSHLKSSAFVVRTEGPGPRPDAFVLGGAGWGHGAGLCQIGAAVMAVRGHDHSRILAHYYPGAQPTRLY